MECKVEGCDKSVTARGWCRRHYMRWHATGDPGPVGLKRLPDHAPCSVDGCERENFAGGYCKMHRWRVRAYGDPGQVGPILKRKPPPRKPTITCSVDGCERFTRYGGSQGMCRLHYRRWVDTGDVGPAGLVIAEQGSGTINSDGYRVIRVNGKSVKEHRYVVEQDRRRPLEKWENIHHLNGIKDDNRLENLELWVTMQPTGQRVSDLVAFVATYYPDEVRQALAEVSG